MQNKNFIHPNGTPMDNKQKKLIGDIVKLTVARFELIQMATSAYNDFNNKMKSSDCGIASEAEIDMSELKKSFLFEYATHPFRTLAEHISASLLLHIKMKPISKTVFDSLLRCILITLNSIYHTMDIYYNEKENFIFLLDKNQQELLYDAVRYFVYEYFTPEYCEKNDMNKIVKEDDYDKLTSIIKNAIKNDSNVPQHLKALK